ncbi:hypothetical protein HW115_08160 [Verrucomicrobiaceae bacterium N1E253]|uniref:Polysaccharide chain length determinant N-terminal domain-containing protein n=1 Tax=Oceaniferula marina TaxID=2748318 RepID=A0A851GFA2_9BACT|nr:hypothetical protein [Oceaniferula marina]NWK55582.1 hypothetical protein [Oceaniferula marina]
MDSAADKSGSKLPKWIVISFIVLPVLGLFISSVVSFMMPRIYESRASVELVPSGVDVEAWGVNQYVETELEVMQSSENLYVVAEMLHLDARWGMADSQSVEVLGNAVNTERVGEGRMIEVVCRHWKKEDAHAICEAVCQAYVYRKSDLQKQREELCLTGIKDDLNIAENNYEELALEYSHVNGTYEGDLEWIGVKRSLEVVEPDYRAALKKKKDLEQELREARRNVMTPTQVMIVHGAPVMPHSSVSPNIQRNQAMGVVAGLLLASLIGGVILVVSLIDRKHRE